MSEKVYFGKDDITPDFLNAENEDPARTVAARSTLRAAEEAAEEETSPTSAEEAENNFSYTGSGRKNTTSARRANSFGGNRFGGSRFGAGGMGKGKKPGKLGKSTIKKSAPLAAIIGIAFAAIFFMFGSASFLGNQIESLFTRATDTMFGSYSENTIRITKELLAGKRGKFPSYLEKRLNGREVTVEEADPGYHLIYGGQTITAATFDDYYQNDINFREAFTTAKRGRSSNFFDYGASFAFAKISLSRNLFRNYRQTGDSSADKTSYHKMGSDIFAGGTNTSLNTVTERQATDEHGNPITDEHGNPVYEKVPSGDNVDSSHTTGDTPTIKARSYLLDISQRVSDAGGLACAALKVGNLVSTAIAVNEIYQAINHFVFKEESIAKTIGGDGEHAAMNQVLNDWSETKTTKYIDAETGEEKEITGSALESQGSANALAGEKINLKKTKDYTVEAAFTTSGIAIGLTAANNRLCGGVRVAGAVISLVSFAVSGALFKSLITLAKTVVVKATLGVTISSMLSALIPRIAKSLFTNTFDDLAGIPDGEVTFKGVDLLQKKVARSNGQLLATEETATTYNAYTVAAAHSEAELDRQSHSPFDATNPNTFLGSFVGKFATIVGGSNLLSSLASATSVVKNSLGSITSSLVSNTYAANFENVTLEKDTTLSGVDFQTVYQDPENCKNLAEIGAACDAYGAEITATHPSVINVSSDDPKYLDVLSRNVTKKPDGTYEVIKNSLLDHKIRYCDERDSPLGIIDSNILQDFEISLGILDYTPGSEDIIDMVNAVAVASDEAMGWALGTYCVMNEEKNPYYEDLLYLQHFEEDQRIATQMHLDEVTNADGSIKDSITAHKEAYYKEHPIDTSEAGLLAHFTGSTKAEAETVIAYLDYLAYLEGYEIPESTLADQRPTFEFPNVTDEPSLDSPTFLNLFALLPAKIEYNVLKDKHYAA